MCHHREEARWAPQCCSSIFRMVQSSKNTTKTCIWAASIPWQTLNQDIRGSGKARNSTWSHRWKGRWLLPSFSRRSKRWTLKITPRQFRSFMVCKSAAGLSYSAGWGGKHHWGGVLAFTLFPLLNHIKTKINTNVTNTILYMQPTEIAIRLLITMQVREAIW